MKNKKIGWMHEVSVVLMIVSTVLFGVVITGCNEVLKQSSLVGKISVDNKSVNLAKWNNVDEKIKTDTSEVIKLIIANNVITLEGKRRNVDELPNSLSKSSHWQNKQVLARIDANQTMGLVDSVFYEFRRFNVRKFIFEGRSMYGNGASYLKIYLPPRKNFETEVKVEKNVLNNDKPYLAITSLLSKEHIIYHKFPIFSIASSDQKDWASHRVDTWAPMDDIINEVPGLNEKYPSTPISGDLTYDIKEFISYHTELGTPNFVSHFYYTKRTVFQNFIGTNNKIREALESYDMTIDLVDFAYPLIELRKKSQKISKPVGFMVLLNGPGKWTYDYQ